MQLVPYFDNWTGSETKLDLKAIYRRPGPGITLTSPLPMRRHHDWSAKGFKYVCLSSIEELGLVAAHLRKEGYDPLPMRECFDRQGHFDVPKYLDAEAGRDSAHAADLQAKVDKFGLDTVTEMMRVSDPDFVMPEGIVEKAKRQKATA